MSTVAVDRRLRAHRLVERDVAARPHRGRRHVPAGAPRARHLVRPLRLRLRRDPRADRLQPALRGQAARGERAHGPVARRRRDQHRSRPRSSSSSGRTRRRSRSSSRPTDASVEQPARRRSARSSAGPGSIPAMLASFASFGVMVSVMNLTGYVVVEKHDHAQHDVFPIIGAHVLGMYALVLVVGALIDRVGRTPALASGLLVMGVSALCARLDAERPGDGVPPLRPRDRLEHLLRRGRSAARRSDAAVGARAPLRVQRLRGCAVRRVARAARRADARDARRRRDGGRRRDHRDRARALDPPGAARFRSRPEFATLRRRRTPVFAFSLP